MIPTNNKFTGKTVTVTTLIVSVLLAVLLSSCFTGYVCAHKAPHMMKGPGQECNMGSGENVRKGPEQGMQNSVGREQKRPGDFEKRPNENNQNNMQEGGEKQAASPEQNNEQNQNKANSKNV